MYSYMVIIYNGLQKARREQGCGKACNKLVTMLKQISDMFQKQVGYKAVRG